MKRLLATFTILPFVVMVLAGAMPSGDAEGHMAPGGGSCALCQCAKDSPAYVPAAAIPGFAILEVGTVSPADSPGIGSLALVPPTGRSPPPVPTIA